MDIAGSLRRAVERVTRTVKGLMGHDVAKTPAPPAGEVPIPYPNVAMSSETSSGAKTVKTEGKEVSTKKSSYKKSTGDEAATEKPGSLARKVTSQKAKDGLTVLFKELRETAKKASTVEPKVLLFVGLIGLVFGSVGGYAAGSIACQNQRLSGFEELGWQDGNLEELVAAQNSDLSFLRESIEEKDSEIGILRETIDELRDRGMQWVRISGIEWDIAGDSLTVVVANLGDMPRTIESVGVRRNVTGSTWYVIENPLSVGSGENVVSIGGSSFVWDEASSQAPSGFLAPSTPYAIAITYYGGYDEIVVVSPEEQ